MTVDWGANAQILLFVIACVALFAGLQKWNSVFDPASKLIRTWRTLDIHVVPIKTNLADEMGTGKFGATVQELLELGFQMDGGYWLYTMTQGPLGHVQLTRRHATAPPPPLADPTGNSEPVVSEFLEHPCPFKPYLLGLCGVLVHPQHHCQALVVVSGLAKHTGSFSEIKLGFLKGTRLDLQAHIVSRNEVWEYTMYSISPPFDSLWRSPHMLFSPCGDTSCATLLQTHLSRRAKIAQIGGFEWGAPLTLSQLMEKETSKWGQIREWAKRHSAVQLVILLWRLKREPNPEWLGDLQGKL